MTERQRANQKTKVLEELAIVPLVEAACRKVALPRSTYYRWRKDDEKFADAVDQALDKGRERICDMAESQLIKKIGNGDLQTIKFWLTNNSMRYKPKKPLEQTRQSYGRPILPILNGLVKSSSMPGKNTMIEIEDDGAEL